MTSILKQIAVLLPAGVLAFTQPCAVGKESRSKAAPEFTIAVLPDTQNYAQERPGDACKEMWISQTEWIIKNRVKHNIAYVVHLGDIVQNGDTLKDKSPNLAEWQVATNAMYRLEDPMRTLLRYGIPYGLAVGNHDQEPIGNPGGATEMYNRYFGISRFQGRPYYGGNFGTNNNNHFDLFSASDLDFIVLYFDHARFDAPILEWAHAVLATNQHRRAIIAMHHLGSAITPSKFSAQGETIYNSLKVHPNVFLMLGGHRSGEGSREDVYEGRTVRSFVADYQSRPNGGNGWMRLLYFSPGGNTVTVQTYSPWLDKYETDEDSEMFFSYDMKKGPSAKKRRAIVSHDTVAPHDTIRTHAAVSVTAAE